MLGGLEGQGLLWTDLGAWREQLLRSPWIRDAALRRSLPSTIEVVVSERTPIGVARVGGTLYLMDDRGVLIDQYGPRYADLDLPIIDGLPPAAAGQVTTDPLRADLAARVIASLGPDPDLTRRLSQVDVTDPHNASVMLTGDAAVIVVGDDQFLPRLRSYLQLAPAIREHVSDIDQLDLRFDNRIFVRPHGKATTSGVVAGRTGGAASPAADTSVDSRRPRPQ
jgi:cell division protein FtsQ